MSSFEDRVNRAISESEKRMLTLFNDSDQQDLGPIRQDVSEVQDVLRKRVLPLVTEIKREVRWLEQNEKEKKNEPSEEAKKEMERELEEGNATPVFTLKSVLNGVTKVINKVIKGEDGDWIPSVGEAWDFLKELVPVGAGLITIYNQWGDFWDNHVGKPFAQRYQEELDKIQDKESRAEAKKQRDDMTDNIVNRTAQELLPQIAQVHDDLVACCSSLKDRILWAVQQTDEGFAEALGEIQNKLDAQTHDILSHIPGTSENSDLLERQQLQEQRRMYSKLKSLVGRGFSTVVAQGAAILAK